MIKKKFINDNILYNNCYHFGIWDNFNNKGDLKMKVEELNNCISRLTNLMFDNPELNRLDAVALKNHIRYKVTIYRVVKVLRIDIKEDF